MADRLGHSLLGEAWRSVWAERVVGDSRDREERREPLAIRVAVELLRGAESYEAREELSKSIAIVGESASDDFIARLYERRILNHVRSWTSLSVPV
jgi:hypothetical protein